MCYSSNVPPPEFILRTNLRIFAGVGLCVCAAAVLSLVMRDADSRIAAPVVCTFPVLAASLLWGRAAAILGGLAASVFFALFLFPPIGSFYVSDPAERLVLILLGSSTVVASLLSHPNRGRAGTSSKVAKEL